MRQRITAIVGSNGSGKTNVLDAIYYTCFTRSYFAKSDKILCNMADAGFRIDALIDKNNIAETVSVIYREDGSKELWVNKEKIPKVSTYLGKNSCVMIAPDDVQLINEGSEYRRKWMDAIFCQTNKEYLTRLQQYQKIITQRNALLKTMYETRQQTNQILDYYNSTLCEHGNYIHGYRKEKLPILLEQINAHYLSIAGRQDAVKTAYISQLNNDSMEQLLKINFQKDYHAQRTSVGIHKDDLAFSMNGELLKQLASQGQKKTFLIALKIAELHYLQNILSSQPILLLDDIFERLDEERIYNLFKKFTQNQTYQIILTDTVYDRVQKLLTVVGADFEIITL